MHIETILDTLNECVHFQLCESTKFHRCALKNQVCLQTVSNPFQLWSFAPNKSNIIFIVIDNTGGWSRSSRFTIFFTSLTILNFWSKMSHNTSNASSFDPFAYFKTLNRALGQKKNLKFDLRAIPGAMMKRNSQMTMFITKEQIQAKFLAKHNKQKNEGQQQEANVAPTKPNTTVNGFNPKSFPMNGIVKRRKKKQEAYINLPSSFFGSFTGPDMSIFKAQKISELKKVEQQVKPQKTLHSRRFSAADSVESFQLPAVAITNRELRQPLSIYRPPVDNFKLPEVPKPKKPDKMAALMNRSLNNLPPLRSYFEASNVPSHERMITQVGKPSAISISTVDVSMDSLRSDLFQPPLASTPFKNLPIQVDPSAILSLLKPSTPLQLPPNAIGFQSRERSEKISKFMAHVDKAAQRLDAGFSKAFPNQPDPITRIQKRLMMVSNASTKQLRRINETLLSDKEEIKNQEVINEDVIRHLTYQEPQPYIRPVPVFYDSSTPGLSKTQAPSFTRQLFAWSPLSDSFEANMKYSPASPFGEDFATQLSLDESRAMFEDGGFLGGSPHNSDETDNGDDDHFLFDVRASSEVKVDDSDDTFNFADYSFDIFSNNEAKKPKNDNTFAIFRSPPKSSRLQVTQKKPSQVHRQPKHYPKISQRKSQRDESRDEFIKPPDGSLTTFKWTPMRNVSATSDFFNNSFNF